jgi:hypothetical protein
MSGVSDTAALAAIGAAARELKLPTVRADAARLAEIPSGNGNPSGLPGRDPLRGDR